MDSYRGGKGRIVHGIFRCNERELSHFDQYLPPSRIAMIPHRMRAKTERRTALTHRNSAGKKHKGRALEMPLGR